MTTLQGKSILFVFAALFISLTSSAQEAGIGYTDKEEFFIGQKRHALKVNFAGNFFGTTKISYEHITKPGRSLELKMTLMNGGADGAFGSFGYKFYKKPTFIAPGMQRRNILEGAYLKPEVFFGKGKKLDWFENQKLESSFGVVLNIGKQWVVGEFIVIDAYTGVGVGTGEHAQGYLSSGGLVLTGGLSFGFAF